MLSSLTPLIPRLRELGYLPAQPIRLAGPATEAGDLVERAAAAYAEFHGIVAEPDAIREHMALPRCGRPDLSLGASEGATGLGQWPRGHRVRVLVKGLVFPGLTVGQTRQVWEQALASWTAVCGINFDLDFQGAPNIRPSVAKIDGPGNTLAYSGMPLSPLSPNDTLTQVYDSREAWSNLSFTQAVIAHEIGHAIGLDHIWGTRTALMNPVISDIITPNALDARGAVERYGPPIYASPGPTPNPPLEIVVAMGVILPAGLYDIILRRQG
jgi:hypothetical protein